MKKYIISGVLVLLFLVSLAFASGTSLMTIKPAQPKSTVILYESGSDLKKQVYPWIRKGYLVEHITGPNSNGNVVVVLTKY